MMTEQMSYTVRRMEELPPDVWKMIPPAFIEAYEALWVGCFKNDVHPLSGSGEEVGRSTGAGSIRWRTNSGQVDTVGTKVKSGSGRSGGGKTVGKTSAALRDERLFREKGLIDKRLRRLARDILAILDPKGAQVERQRRCTGSCKRLGQSDWLFCPNCGGPMAETD
jgi:hypothetical protein